MDFTNPLHPLSPLSPLNPNGIYADRGSGGSSLRSETTAAENWIVVIVFTAIIVGIGFAYARGWLGDGSAVRSVNGEKDI